jgi:hypothetical protein
MDARRGVLLLVGLAVAILLVRGAVAVLAGDYGTVARQTGIALVLTIFGGGLYRRWDQIA